jgi:CheY-like chemotaxis protein
MTDMARAQKSTALVIDNDPLVLLGTVIMMRELGYDVRSTGSTDEAIAAFDVADAPDILVTDYSMPKMTGVDLARGIILARPDTRVLIVTGHQHLADDMPDGWKILTKPFSGAELDRALNQLGFAE